MNSDIEIVIADDEFHDRVFAEILIDGKLLVVLSQEEGPDNLLLEFPGEGHSEEMLVRKINLESLEVAIQKAKQVLFAQQS